jgi:hypothetical protein
MFAAGLLDWHITKLMRLEGTLALALEKEKSQVTRPFRGPAFPKPMSFSRFIGINIMLHSMMSDHLYPAKQQEGTVAYAAVKRYIAKLERSCWHSY